MTAEKLQVLLPTTWRSAPLPPGPSEGGNLMVIFRSALQVTRHDADGTDRIGEQDRGAVFLAAVKNSETQEPGVLGYARIGRESRERSRSISQFEARDGPDGATDGDRRSWEQCRGRALATRAEDGQELSMNLRYGLGMPFRNSRGIEGEGRNGPELQSHLPDRPAASMSHVAFRAQSTALKTLVSGARFPSSKKYSTEASGSSASRSTHGT